MICAGRKTSKPLTFNECATKANKYHTDKMWVATLPYYGAMLELTERYSSVKIVITSQHLKSYPIHRTLGLFHPQVAQILEAMHTCYTMMGKYEQSIACVQRILIIKELMSEAMAADPAKGPEHADAVEASKAVFSTMGHLAELYMSSGNLKLAKVPPIIVPYPIPSPLLRESTSLRTFS